MITKLVLLIAGTGRAGRRLVAGIHIQRRPGGRWICGGIAVAGPEPGQRTRWNASLRSESPEPEAYLPMRSHSASRPARNTSSRWTTAASKQTPRQVCLIRTAIHPGGAWGPHRELRTPAAVSGTDDSRPGAPGRQAVSACLPDVLDREPAGALLLHETEVAGMPAPVAHRRALEAPRREPVRGEPGRVQIRRDVRDPHGSPEVADVPERHGALRPLRGALMLLVGQAGGDAFPSAPGLVDPHDRGVAGLRPFTRAPADFVGDDPGPGSALMRRPAAQSFDRRSRSASLRAVRS